MAAETCSMCWQGRPVALVTDHEDRLARQLGYTPTGSPWCFDCLGRNLGIRAQLKRPNLAIERLPHLEQLDPCMFATVAPQGMSAAAHCGGCGSVTATLYTTSGDAWTTFPKSLCDACVGKHLARRLLDLEPGQYPLSIKLAETQPPEPEMTRWSMTMLGPKPAPVDFNAEGRHAGDIVCLHCANILAKVGTRGQEITVVIKTPALGGMSSVPDDDEQNRGFLGVAVFGPQQRTNVQTVVRCWNGHDGLGIHYDLCREVVAASRKKRRPVRRPAVQLAPAPPGTIETSTNSEP